MVKGFVLKKKQNTLQTEFHCDKRVSQSHLISSYISLTRVNTDLRQNSDSESRWCMFVYILLLKDKSNPRIYALLYSVLYFM